MGNNHIASNTMQVIGLFDQPVSFSHMMHPRPSVFQLIIMPSSMSWKHLLFQCCVSNLSVVVNAHHSLHLSFYILPAVQFGCVWYCSTIAPLIGVASLINYLTHPNHFCMSCFIVVAQYFLVIYYYYYHYETEYIYLCAMMHLFLNHIESICILIIVHTLAIFLSCS